MAIESGDADAEMVRIGLVQFRDVVGDCARVFGGKFGMAIGQEPQQRRFRIVPAKAVARQRACQSHIHRRVLPCGCAPSLPFSEVWHGPLGLSSRAPALTNATQPANTYPWLFYEQCRRILTPPFTLLRFLNAA